MSIWPVALGCTLKATESDATANWQQSQSDADHLRLLSIFHYVVAGILALCSLFLQLLLNDLDLKLDS